METHTATSEIGVVGRLIRIFYAPGEVYESLAHQRSAADWFVPTTIAALLGIVIAAATIPLATQSGLEQMQNMPAEQREMMELGQKIAQVGGMIAAPLMTFLFLLIASALLLLVGKMLGAEINFGQAMPVYAYGSMIGTLKAIIITTVMVAKETMIVHTGLGIFLGDEMMQTFTGRMLAGIDIFTVWQAIVTAIGLAIVGQIPTGKAIGGVLVLVAIAIVIGAGLGGIGEGFKPGS